MSFFILGKTTEKKSNLKKKIETWGGSVASKVVSNVAVIISSKGIFFLMF